MINSNLHYHIMKEYALGMHCIVLAVANNVLNTNATCQSFLVISQKRLSLLLVMKIES